MSNRRRAVALISGGLDSMLAAKAIVDQGVEVEGINFFTGFCHSGHTSAIRNKKKEKPPRNDALWVAEQLGIKLHIIDIVDEYKAILLSPKHGYGQNLNPCLDCKIFMVQKAHQWMLDNGFDFLITGEVVGQRPKSQRRETMPIVEKHSGAEDRLLRPLCAKHLPITLPEREGWVDREKLYDFHGRSRKPQLALAERFHFDDYAQPAGGCCVLTDANYTRRLQDMWDHRQTRDYDMDDIILLKAGRHLRPSEDYKLIVGRDMGENNFLEGYRHQFTHLRVKHFKGPLVLIDGKPSAEDLNLAARITARFSGGREESMVEVEVMEVGGSAYQLEVNPLPTPELDPRWYL